ncbi:MAG: UbiD family decarboxylase [Nitrososphaerota archaeon]|nr:UbiD family decarboxylase [Nitrososphaerota archaeon]MDG6922655.1 UbiD family decarboxylase [Nitrososphaerota archaeon]
MKSWHCDGGRFITIGFAVTKNSETQQRDMGVYRMQIFGQYAVIVRRLRILMELIIFTVSFSRGQKLSCWLSAAST